MPSKKGASLTELLDMLSVNVQNEEHANVLDLANKILRQNPADKKAIRAKTIALIKLERYVDALAAATGGGATHATELALERGYCHYRVGQLEVASDVVATALASKELGAIERRGLIHLQAQIAYRLENFSQAKDLYSALGNESALVEGETHDILVNSLAIDAQQSFNTPGSTDSARPVTALSHEAAYNLASLHIGEHRYRDALALLQQAKSLAQSVEGLSEEELEDELSPILIQAAYVHILLGEKEEATNILCGIKSDDIAQPLIKDLIIHNLLAIGDVPGYINDNPHVTLRLLDSVVHTKTSKSSYVRFQKRLLQKNRLTIEYQAGKEKAVKSGIKRHLAEYPDDESVRLLQFRPAVMDPFSTGGKYHDKTVLKRALKRFESDPGNVSMGFAIIQLLVQQKNIDHAAEIAEKLLQNAKTKSPGLVAVVSEIFEQQGRKDKLVV
ncbi:uncharacterized protein V1518DRAFT_410369 [Limtongia smithiae]|uniref:uncharacterized protein n=1 Tax=Limtongia smithiae TaxID=1125753 RepID=UPI0034D013B4